MSKLDRLKKLTAGKGRKRTGKSKLEKAEGLAAIAALRRGASLPQVNKILGNKQKGSSAYYPLATWAIVHCKCA